MTLSEQDAYALRRALSMLDLPDGLPLSPMVAALLAKLDWKNTPAHWGCFSGSSRTIPLSVPRFSVLIPLRLHPPVTHQSNTHSCQHCQRRHSSVTNWLLLRRLWDIFSTIVQHGSASARR